MALYSRSGADQKIRCFHIDQLRLPRPPLLALLCGGFDSVMGYDDGVYYSAQGKQLSKKAKTGFKSVAKQAPAPKVISTIRCLGASKVIKVNGATPKCSVDYRLDESPVPPREVLAR